MQLGALCAPAADQTSALGIAFWVSAVERHRLLPQAVLPGAFEEPLHAALCDRYRAIIGADRARVAMQERAMRRICSLLPGDAFIAIKGIDLGRRLYGDPVLRPMDDIDLLLHDDAIRDARQVLTKAGWSVLRVSHLELSVQCPETRVIVDLYRGFTQRERAAIDYPGIWRQAARGEHGALVLSPAHALLADALIVANLQFITHLRKLLDVFLLARDDAVVVEAIELAREWRMRRSFFACLHQVRKLAPELSDRCWWPAVEALVTRAERRHLIEHVLPVHAIIDRTTAPRIAVGSRIRRKFALIDEPVQRLHFTAAHAVRMLRMRT